jgi:hypothetical protein
LSFIRFSRLIRAAFLFPRVGAFFAQFSARRSLMTDNVLVGSGRRILSVPRQHWEQQLAAVPEHQETRLAFMSPEHHRIRYFVVEQLVRVGAPLTPDWISQGVGLPVARVNAILEELERNLVFLVRNERGAVSWAFPVTVDPTPHHLGFGTGEQVYAA